MSHSSISATRDHVNKADHGDLTNPAQSAGFVSDPLLTPITTSSMPHPVHADPSPSDDPTQFDPSTRHANSHYHPEAKLSKKKRAKKLGLGTVTHSTAKTSNVGGRTFSEHDKQAHERAEAREGALGHGQEEEFEDDEEDDDDEGHTHAEEEHQSHKQHAENRITGTEQGRDVPLAKPNAKAGEGQKEAGEADKAEGEEGDKDEAGQSLKDKASGVLSGAQEKASGLLATAQEKATGVLDSVKSVPLVGSLLSKVGLGSGAAKGEDTTKEENAQASKEEEA